jgi:threonine aldolase
LAKELVGIQGVRLTWPTQANEVFAILPKRLAKALEKAGAHFYAWPHGGLPANEVLSDEETYVRLVTSFRTTDQDVAEFSAAARRE